MQNNYEIQGDSVLIEVGRGYQCLIDKKDFDAVNSIPGKWYLQTRNGVPSNVFTPIKDSSGKVKTINLPRLILFGWDGKQHFCYIRYKNGNKLDCRRENLVSNTKHRDKVAYAVDLTISELISIFLEKMKSHDVIKFFTNEKGQIEFWLQPLTGIMSMETNPAECCFVLAYELEEIENLTVSELIKKLKNDAKNAPVKQLYERRFVPDEIPVDREKLKTYFEAGYNITQTAAATHLPREKVSRVFEEFESQEYGDGVI